MNRLFQAAAEATEEAILNALAAAETMTGFAGHIANALPLDFVVRNGTQVPGGPPNPGGFHTREAGTYPVNADCTGTANIVLGPGNERTVALVISKAARTIHAVVSSAVIGGQPGVAQVHSDFEKIDD